MPLPQFKTLKAAKPGAKSPKSDTPCEVHYRGTLIGSGDEFHCSWTRQSDPERHVPLKSIQGWQVALQLMGVGDKWALWMPAHLGYGDAGWGGGKIPPGAALAFEIELCSLKGDERCRPKVVKPAGMAMDEILAARAPRPRAESADIAPSTPSRTPPATPTRAHGAGGTLFERASTTPRASSALLPRGGAAVVRPTGHCDDDSQDLSAERDALLSQLGEAKREAEEARTEAAGHAAHARQLSEENARLRAALKRAKEAHVPAGGTAEVAAEAVTPSSLVSMD